METRLFKVQKRTMPTLQGSEVPPMAGVPFTETKPAPFAQFTEISIAAPVYFYSILIGTFLILKMI